MKRDRNSGDEENSNPAPHHQQTTDSTAEMGNFSAEEVERIVATAVRAAMQAAPKQQAIASGDTIMDHLNARIPRLTFNSETAHTFEKGVNFTR